MIPAAIASLKNVSCLPAQNGANLTWCKHELPRLISTFVIKFAFYLEQQPLGNFVFGGVAKKFSEKFGTSCALFNLQTLQNVMIFN